MRTVLDELRTRHRLGIVTDGQAAYARPELAELNLLDYFEPVVVSGEHGFRKPDRRLFSTALDALQVAPEHTVYIGNDPFRDIHGARRAGLRTVLYAPDNHAGTIECECLCTPDHVISDHRQLTEILE